MEHLPINSIVLIGIQKLHIPLKTAFFAKNKMQPGVIVPRRCGLAEQSICECFQKPTTHFLNLILKLPSQGDSVPYFICCQQIK